jgi:hypothetical protein
VYTKVHKYIKAKICMARITQLHTSNDAAWHFVFECSSCSACVCFHNSNNTRYSQPFGAFRVLQKNNAFVP